MTTIHDEEFKIGGPWTLNIVYIYICIYTIIYIYISITIHSFIHNGCWICWQNRGSQVIRCCPRSFSVGKALSFCLSFLCYVGNWSHLRVPQVLKYLGVNLTDFSILFPKKREEMSSNVTRWAKFFTCCGIWGNLQSLSFHSFSRHIFDHVNLPSSVQSLTFGRFWTHSYEHVTCLGRQAVWFHIVLGVSLQVQTGLQVFRSLMFFSLWFFNSKTPTKVSVTHQRDCRIDACNIWYSFLRNSFGCFGPRWVCQAFCRVSPYASWPQGCEGCAAALLLKKKVPTVPVDFAKLNVVNRELIRPSAFQMAVYPSSFLFSSNLSLFTVLGEPIWGLLLIWALLPCLALFSPSHSNCSLGETLNSSLDLLQLPSRYLAAWMMCVPVDKCLSEWPDMLRH